MPSGNVPSGATPVVTSPETVPISSCGAAISAFAWVAFWIKSLSSCTFFILASVCGAALFSILSILSCAASTIFQT